jgi:hypothetical protein
MVTEHGCWPAQPSAARAPRPALPLAQVGSVEQAESSARREIRAFPRRMRGTLVASCELREMYQPILLRNLMLLLAAFAAVACGGSATESGAGDNGGARADSGSNANAGGNANASGGAGGTSASCEQAAQDYVNLALSQASSNGGLSCTTNSDCADMVLGACGSACTEIVVGRATEASISAALAGFARAYCSGCAFVALPCVGADTQAVCVAGTCQQNYPL